MASLSKPITVAGPRTKAASRGRMPTKRTINLAKYDTKKTNWWLAIPGIIIILILAFLFGKFAVADPLAKLAYEEGRAASLQRQVNEGYEKIDSFGDLTEEYAHYTYSHMTPEELERVDRGEILRMLQRVILPQATVTGWNVKGNQMTVNISADSLQELNELAEKLREEEIVEFCSISNAATYIYEYQDRTVADLYGVNGTLIIYLNAAGRGDLG